MKKVSFQGTITALVTPFNKKGEIDFKALKKLIDFQIDNNVEGILIGGSTGESATLTPKEKQALIIKAVEFAGGRVPIIAGTGSNETETTAALSLFAKEQGADAVLLVAPFYNKPPQQGIYEHFRLIANYVDLPVIIYNVPGRTAVNITAETQLRLAEDCPNITAAKEASGNLSQIMEIIRNAPEGFQLLSGDDALTLPIISIGGKGIVSVISNYAPKEFSDMVRTALDGRFEEARKIHYALFELMELNFLESNPIPVKAAMKALNLCTDSVRMPLLPMSNKNKAVMRKALETAALIKPKKK